MIDLDVLARDLERADECATVRGTQPAGPMKNHLIVYGGCGECIDDDETPGYEQCCHDEWFVVTDDGECFTGEGWPDDALRPLALLNVVARHVARLAVAS